MNTMSAEQMVGILHNTTVALVRRPGPDLTARQLAMFLSCYLEATPQTVRGLAAHLRVSKPAVTRAVDRLAEFDLIRRKRDPADRRSVQMVRTLKGNAFLRDLTKIMGEAAVATSEKPGAARRSSRSQDAA